jgi:hypothetical protein
MDLGRNLFLVINGNGSINITPTAFTVNDTVSVTVDGSTYSVVGTGTLSTTIDNFVSAHKQVLSDFHNIFVSDATTHIEFSNIADTRSITAVNALVGARYQTEDASVILGTHFQSEEASNEIEVYFGSFEDGDQKFFLMEFENSYQRERGLEEIKNALRQGAKSGYNINLPYKAYLVKNALITEAGDFLTTEDGNILTTEQE